MADGTSDRETTQVETTLNPHIAAQLIRYWMKQARTKAKKSQAALANLLGLAQPTIAGFESGRSLPVEDHLRMWLEFCDRPGDFTKLQPVLATAASEKPRGEVVQITGVANTSLRLGLDYFATSIKEYIPNLVPGLLQIENTARAVIDPYVDLWPPTAVEVDQAKLRIDRQDVFRQEDPPQYTAFIDEKTLRLPIGGAEAQVAQLRFLLEVTDELPHVAVQVIPESIAHHPVNFSQLALLTFGDDAPLATSEDWNATHYYNHPDAIATATRLLGHLGRVGLDPSDSRRRIEQIVKEVAA
jgi:transcriptional regulator with XRE-family HTH domain